MLYDDIDMAHERKSGWNGGCLFGLGIGIVGTLIGCLIAGIYL